MAKKDSGTILTTLTHFRPALLEVPINWLIYGIEALLNVGPIRPDDARFIRSCAPSRFDDQEPY